MFSFAGSMSVIKKEAEEERVENIAAEADWRLVVKVEHDTPLDMSEATSVYLQQEDGDTSPKIMTG